MLLNSQYASIHLCMSVFKGGCVKFRKIISVWVCVFAGHLAVHQQGPRLDAAGAAAQGAALAARLRCQRRHQRENGCGRALHSRHGAMPSVTTRRNPLVPRPLRCQGGRVWGGGGVWGRTRAAKFTWMTGKGHVDLQHCSTQTHGVLSDGLAAQAKRAGGSVNQSHGAHLSDTFEERCREGSTEKHGGVLVDHRAACAPVVKKLTHRICPASIWIQHSPVQSRPRYPGFKQCRLALECELPNSLQVATQ